MATPRVVPAFDEIEDRETGLHLRPEAMPVKELTLERREEAFAERVVVTLIRSCAPHTHSTAVAGSPMYWTRAWTILPPALCRGSQAVARLGM
jgi:hypothetical protein